MSAQPQINESGQPAGPEPLALDVAGVLRLFPGIGLRTWRSMDGSGKVPQAIWFGGRKFWRLNDLKLWTELGFPDRVTFEKEKRWRLYEQAKNQTS